MVDLTDQTLLFALGTPNSTLVRCCVDESAWEVVSTAADWDALVERGWQVDLENKFSAFSRHRCPEHRVQYWITWCHDPDCGSCSSNDEKIVMAPEQFDEETVTTFLETETCKNLEPIYGVEKTEDPPSFMVDFSPDITIPFPAPQEAQRERLL